MKAKRQFTDAACFTLRCGVCGCGIVGQDGAVKHARDSGHTNFQEYQ
jgi:ubiquitin thioesterase OTU1